MNLKKKYTIYLIPLTLVILIEFFSLYYAQFHYDGFHIGLLLNAANDLNSGKLIYKDFFYEYGVLNGYLNLLILKVFNNNIYSLFAIYSQFYVLGIILLYFLTKKKLGVDYAALFIIIIFIVHPFLIKPWHNYLLFFFISAFLYMKSLFKIKYDLFSSLILGIAFLFSETFLVTSFLVLIIDLIHSFKVFGKRILLKKITLFLLPIISFFIFLFANNLITDWLLYNETYPVLLKYFYKTDIYSYILDHFKILLFAYKYLYSDTVIILYSLIYLGNFIFIIINLKNFYKNKLNKLSLFFLLLASLNLILISQTISSIATFKLATLSSFGLLIILFFIKNIKESYLRRLMVSLIILICLNSFFDEKKSWISERYQFSENNIKSKKFDFLKTQRYPKLVWSHLEKFDKITLDIRNKCNIKFFANFTDDAFYYHLTRDKFEFSQFLYWFRNQERYYQNNFYSSLTELFDNKFTSRIIDRMNNKNIFFITDAVNKDNIFLIDKNISFKEGFNYIYLPYTSVHGSKVVLLPKNCIIL